MTRRCLALDAATGTQIAVPTQVVSGTMYTVTRVRVALLTVQGYWPSDSLFGLPWPNWITDVTTPTVVIEGIVRLLLRPIPGIEEIVSIDVTRNGGDLNIAVSLRISSGNVSDPSVTATIGDIPDPRVPGAWYILVPVQPTVPY